MKKRTADDAPVSPEPTVALHYQDCIEGLWDKLPDNSVHLTVTSIPFEELFTYSGKLEDVGNNGSTVDPRVGRFALNMRFVIAQLLRVTAPGCNVCIHIQQLLAYKNQHGFSGRRNFRDAMIDIFSAGGFEWKGEVAIPKDPQQMAQKLHLISLQFKTGHSRSSTDWAPAPNDYVLIFQKPGEPLVPVRPLVYLEGKSPLNRVRWAEKNHGWNDRAYLDYLRHWGRTNEAINPDGWLCSDDWVKWASGIWPDILQTDVLDGWKSARETDEEKHVCPLQLSVIYRLVQMYSNPISIQPDVTVLDPFMGIASTAYVCVGGATQDGRLTEGMERNVTGFELKLSYHDQGNRNIEKLFKKKRKADKAGKERMLF